MDTPSSSTLVHSLQKPRWRIDVHRPKDVYEPLDFTVFLTGIVAADFHRSRHMPLSLYRQFTNCLAHSRRELHSMLDKLNLEDVPRYPQAVGMTTAQGDAFRTDLALSRRLDGTLETMLAVYDLDDDSAPMLLVTDDQIAELCEDCIGVLSAFAIEIDDAQAEEGRCS